MKFKGVHRFYAQCRIFLIISAICLAGCVGGQKQYNSVDVETFAKLIRSESVTLLDVRTADEFQKGHIDGAMNIDFRDSSFCEHAVAELDSEDTIAVYCWSGRRSSAAAIVLAEEGFCVVNLKGGYKEFCDTIH